MFAFSLLVFCWMCVLFHYVPCASAYLRCLASWKHSSASSLTAQLANGTVVGQDQLWNAASRRKLSAFCIVQELSGGFYLVTVILYEITPYRSANVCFTGYEQVIFHNLIKSSCKWNKAEVFLVWFYFCKKELPDEEYPHAVQFRSM